MTTLNDYNVVDTLNDYSVADWLIDTGNLMTSHILVILCRYQEWYLLLVTEKPIVFRKRSMNISSGGTMI